MAQKMQKTGSIKTALSVFQKISSEIQTNLSLDQIAALAGFMQDFDLKNLTRHTVESSGMKTSSGAAVQKINKKAFEAYILDYFYQEK